MQNGEGAMPIRVLIADDEEMARMLVARVGCTVQLRCYA